MSKPRRPRKCFNCGRHAITREHIPPRGIFPERIRATAQLITVPACATCNEGSSLDDEYFRTALCADWNANPVALEVWIEEVRPALQRTDFGGLKRLLQRSVRPFSVVVGNQELQVGVFAGDRDRIASVLRKVVKGLYLHEKRELLPGDHSVTLYIDPQKSLPSDQFKWLMDMAMQANVRVVDKNVFSYRWAIADQLSIWWLLFYEARFVVAFTASPEEEQLTAASAATSVPPPPT